MRARAPIGVLRQILNACFAAATARFTSAVVASGTRARTSWVAGLMTSRQWVVVESNHSPLISSLTRGAEALTRELGEAEGEAAMGAHHRESGSGGSAILVPQWAPCSNLL